MQTFTDKEFGEVKIRRSPLARYVRVRVERDGRLSASLPLKSPLRLVSELIEQSRDELRPIITEYKSKKTVRSQGATVGKSHTLHIKYAQTAVPKSRIANQQITIYLPLEADSNAPEYQHYINTVVKRVLKKEAESYLPRRVRYLAEQHGFQVNSIRFNNAATRWGSCSANGNINLNIALMQLPLELIDYVIIHELCHTKHMNHGEAFWELVSNY